MWLGYFEWSLGEWEHHLFNKGSETISLVIWSGLLLGFNDEILFLNFPRIFFVESQTSIPLFQLLALDPPDKTRNPQYSILLLLSETRGQKPMIKVFKENDFYIVKNKTNTFNEKLKLQKAPSCVNT